MHEAPAISDASTQWASHGGIYVARSEVESQPLAVLSSTPGNQILHICIL